MISFKTIIGAVVLSGLLGSFTLSAAESQPQGAKSQKLKPYTLKTCIVTDEKLGEMGQPFVYQYQDREIKFCCKSCLKDFNKEPAKFIKKLEAAEKAPKAGNAAVPADHGSHKH